MRSTTASSFASTSPSSSFFSSSVPPYWYPPSSPTRRSSDLLPLYTLHRDAAPMSGQGLLHNIQAHAGTPRLGRVERLRSEEHTSELQSPCNFVCRLLLEKKKR